LTRVDVRNKLFETQLVILVDTPRPSRLTSDRPLYYVPELERKTYYHDNMPPVEAVDLRDALISLTKSISPVRVLCHPDVRQWIGVTIRPHEMRTAVISAFYEARR
jgi:hypothetical protein